MKVTINKNALYITIFIMVILGIFKFTFADSDEEIVKKLIDKYNIEKEENRKENDEKIKETEKEINNLLIKKDILIACNTNNNATYNTTSRPINCENEIEKQLVIANNWLKNSNGKSQAYFPIIANKKKERIDIMLIKNGREEDVYHQRWERIANKYSVDEALLVCIAKADSSLGNALSTKNNFGNVGNNDRGDRIGFNTPIEGIEAIGKVLKNKYLGKKKHLYELSKGGFTSVGKKYNGEFLYATSEENWHINVKNCLSLLEGELVDDYYLINK